MQVSVCACYCQRERCRGLLTVVGVRRLLLWKGLVVLGNYCEEGAVGMCEGCCGCVSGA